MKTTSAVHAHTAATPAQLLRDDRPQIAFVGRSNVGKSSLLNRLLARRRLARTSRTPGRTRQVVYFLINDAFYFVDLPGYGYARADRRSRAQWAELVDAYISQLHGRGVLVHLVDARVGATDLDVDASHYFGDHGLRPIVVATKIDKLKRGQRTRGLAEIHRRLGLSDDQYVHTSSAVSGEGVRELWKEILTSKSRPKRPSPKAIDPTVAPTHPR